MNIFKFAKKRDDVNLLKAKELITVFLTARKPFHYWEIKKIECKTDNNLISIVLTISTNKLFTYKLIYELECFLEDRTNLDVEIKLINN